MLYHDAFDRVTMNVLTSFPFTFKLTIPGLSNPFSSLTSTSPTTGTNPPRLPPVDTTPPQPDFSTQSSRSFVRPTRPLPLTLGHNAMLGSRNLRESQASYSPTSSPAPHSYSHLTPKLLSPYEEWQQSQPWARPSFESYSPPPGPPVSRKRGWEPSFSSPSGSEATLTSTSGYLVKPGKYREMTDGMDLVEVDRDDGSRELDADDLPPAKRRRGLAGSLVSTAWNAALLGTAVGLSVFRFWKGGDQVDNSQQEQEDGHFRKRRIVDATSDAMSIESPPPSPPPPYTSTNEWTAVDYPRALQLTPRNTKGKSRASATPRNSTRKTSLGARTSKARHHHHIPSRTAIPRAGPSRPPIHEAFDFNFNGQASSPASIIPNPYPTTTMNSEVEPEIDDVDEQMDWIGGKLAQLIEEGKKALGKEVVVMSEAREDEVDDGSGAWVSDEEREGKRRRSGSIRRRGSIASVKYTSTSLGRRSAAPSVPATTQTTPQRQVHTTTPGIPSFDEPTGDMGCESPEVREMMERARAKFAGRTMAR